ncbi:hypothetical protein BJY52DRAFT_1422103 [Lactarius psammicola]|nr:hypothetical protein BJY52DRAFT_1422103 [Lactarius psammicola]
MCLKFKITDEEIDFVCNGFVDWVENYERFYYQHDAGHMSACPVTIHALLHIADSIKTCGPVWCYWAFPMERYCNRLKPAIRNRRTPYTSIDQYVLEDAQLTQIKAIYALIERPANGSIREPLLIEEWGKVQRVDSEAGDTIHSSGLIQPTADCRDTTFVRYVMLVDRFAHMRRRKPKLELQTSYGQLEHLYLITFACSDTRVDPQKPIILAAIRNCKIKDPGPTDLEGLDIHLYNATGSLNLIDITSVQVLVGRVEYSVDGGGWAIIDRSGSLARAEWDPTGDDEPECLISEAAIPAAVINGFHQQQFVHFACHGTLEAGKPFEAGFELYGVTEESIVDEVLHLAAAVQYCGFRSVVGTMWAMVDEDGRDLAEHFYKALFSNSRRVRGVLYFERSAKALRVAVKKLRRKKRITLERWVNFVHYGA